MQKLGNLRDWEILQAGNYFVFEKTNSSRVKIEVNSDDLVRLSYVPLKKGKPDTSVDTIHLCQFDGLDEVQVNLPFSIAVTSDSDCFIKTNSGMMRIPDQSGPSFTKVIERRKVNPDVAAVIQRSNANQRVMASYMAQMATKLDLNATAISELENAKTVQQPKGDTVTVEPTTEPQPTVEPTSPAPATTDTSEGVKDEKTIE